MNPKILCMLTATILTLSASVFAAAGKTYQVTGTIVVATGTTLAVEKDGEKYEFAIDPATIKGSAELKVGSSVTVTYVMSATKIESSGASAAATRPTP
jgi:hypothetical protein